MATTFKDLDVSSDIKSTKTQLSQLVDIVQQDISGSSTRKQYAIFVTASSDTNQTYAVTSSLFQTVFDQDHSLQVSNAMFDMTVGLYWSGSTAGSASSGVDSKGKYLYPSSSLMMREKTEMYKLFAGKLLGDSETSFFAPTTSTTSDSRIDEAIFISFKRLFARDAIKRNTFAMRFFTTGVFSGGPENISVVNGYTGSNTDKTSPSGSAIFTDSVLSSNLANLFGGRVGSIVNSSNTSQTVGLLWYDAGIAVLDAKKVCMADQHISGTISATTGSVAPPLANQTIIGSSNRAFGSVDFAATAATRSSDNTKGFQLIDSTGVHAQITINTAAADGVLSGISGVGSSGSPLLITIGMTSATFTDVVLAPFFKNAIDALRAHATPLKIFAVVGAAGLVTLRQVVPGAAGNTTITTVAGALVGAATIISFTGGFVIPGANPNARVIPDLMVSASMDDLVNYFTTTRFSSGSLTGITFQNQTAVNSTLFFCRAGADEFNYSNNPTYFDDSGNLVIMTAQESLGITDARPFTYPTTVGLYDEQNRLLAVAKFSRPIEKNDEKDLTIRVRLDFAIKKKTTFTL